MLLNQNNDSWKDQPYVWMLILIPFSAVVVGMIMLSLAIQSDTGLVVDDYYKKGKQINRVLARDQVAAEMGLSASLNLDSESWQILVDLNSESGLQSANQINIGFFHATRAGLDQTSLLQSNNSQNYTGTFKPLAKGRWHVHLSTENWRLTGSLYVPGDTRLKFTTSSAKQE